MNRPLISILETDPRRHLASIDELIQSPEALGWINEFGRPIVLNALNGVIQDARQEINAQLKSKSKSNVNGLDSESANANTPVLWQEHMRLQNRHNLMHECRQRLLAQTEPHLKEVINLTGTVLHTNFGRALYAQAAIDAATLAMRASVNLEYDLITGKRGERDDHVESLLCELTGAQAATVVNNNAAAVLLSLSTLAQRKEVLLSRGELVEIGGSFRIPDVMKRAGAVLKEVGTTNRTHLKDFEENITPKVSALMKVHTSNYSIQGFTAEVSVEKLSKLAQAHALPLIVDLGSGTLMDMKVLGLSHEPTVAEVMRSGAHVVTFSGDKLLGGPQCGIIVGDKALIERVRKNPLRRALRLDKVMIAALEATLKLYLNPEQVQHDLPTLRLFKREVGAIEAQCRRLFPLVQKALIGKAVVSIESCTSQVGSGALPVQTMPSYALIIKPLKSIKASKPAAQNKAQNDVNSEKTLSLKTTLTMSEQALERMFRQLSTPVLGRLQKGQLVLDLRCLEERQEQLFCAALSQMVTTARP